MTFTSAAAAQKVLEAFAAARAALMGIDNAAPLPEPDGAQFARNVISLTWIDAPTYAIVRGNRYSDAQRRTIYWPTSTWVRLPGESSTTSATAA
ncbi:hypothetical protein GS445_06805 [Rhodococcus hoagii]|nr:hypothetical protein [Prescottella equi]